MTPDKRKAGQTLFHEVERRIVWVVALHAAMSRGPSKAGTTPADGVADAALAAYDKRFEKITDIGNEGA